MWLLLLVVVLGCARASYVPVDGGYQLLATAPTEKAIARLKRTANDLCPGGYEMSTVRILGEGFEFGANAYVAKGHSTETLEVFVRCK